MTEQVFFRSGGKVYELVEIDHISLRDLITFPRDAEEVLGEPMTWARAQELNTEIQALPPAERDDHPMGPFVLSMVIWASRRAAGDVITFGECLNESFSWVNTKQPGDRKPGKRSGAKKAPGKKRPTPRPPRDSVPADEDPAATESPET